MWRRKKKIWKANERNTISVTQIYSVHWFSKSNILLIKPEIVGHVRLYLPFIFNKEPISMSLRNIQHFKGSLDSLFCALTKNGTEHTEKTQYTTGKYTRGTIGLINSSGVLHTQKSFIRHLCSAFITYEASTSLISWKFSFFHQLMN